MIISNQEIAVHLATLRNLTLINTGRYCLRIGLTDPQNSGVHKAIPVCIIDQE
jgi:hypothetical protein